MWRICHAAGVSTSATGLEQLGALLLLISPFFFWGTSMVAMKVGTCLSKTAHGARDVA